MAAIAGGVQAGERSVVMAETWGNGHYSCYGCKHQGSRDAFDCKNCFTYTPLMQPYYKNWTKKEISNADKIRSMSDSELAEYLEPKWFDCSDFCEDFGAGCAYTCKHNKGAEFLLNWLKSPTTD